MLQGWLCPSAPGINRPNIAQPQKHSNCTPVVYTCGARCTKHCCHVVLPQTQGGVHYNLPSNILQPTTAILLNITRPRRFRRLLHCLQVGKNTRIPPSPFIPISPMLTSCGHPHFPRLKTSLLFTSLPNVRQPSPTSSTRIAYLVSPPSNIMY